MFRRTNKFENPCFRPNIMNFTNLETTPLKSANGAPQHDSNTPLIAIDPNLISKSYKRSQDKIVEEDEIDKPISNSLTTSSERPTLKIKRMSINSNAMEVNSVDSGCYSLSIVNSQNKNTSISSDSSHQLNSTSLSNHNKSITRPNVSQIVNGREIPKRMFQPKVYNVLKHSKQQYSNNLLLHSE